ncbi:MAG: hypothetical protein HOH19_07445 [Kordiimonadaceae bacterium]|nr:hypothetical protein [Kordiimonadaceae bacterium]
MALQLAAEEQRRQDTEDKLSALKNVHAKTEEEDAKLRELEKQLVIDLNNAKDEIGGIFSFKLDDRFSVLNQRDARYVSQQLDYSIGVLQSAYRSLTFDPLAAQLKKDALKGGQGGRVPPHLLKQISNYQDGLNRISALVPQGGVIT